MSITCQDFANLIGAHCHQVDSSTLFVSSPLSFPDNTPVNLYVETVGHQFLVTDDGDTLMRLHAMGLGVNTRLAGSLDSRAKANNGSIQAGRLEFRSDSLRAAYDAYLRTMIEIIRYEQEHTALPVERVSAINAVVEAITRRNPGCHIERDVYIKGRTGASYPFPIKAGDRFVDVTRPHHQSTGSILRRASDIEMAGCREPLIVVDDTENPGTAEREASLIGAFAPAMLLSSLKSESSPLDLENYH